MKVAIVHYWLISLRGGEKVVQSMLKLYPDADVYTLFADPGLIEEHFSGHKVYASWFNKPFFRRNYQKLFPLYPLFVATLKLRGNYDLILSSESGPAKGIHKPKHTRHICYVHTPMRYAWGFTHEYLRVLPRLARPVARFFFKMLQLWDKTTVKNVDEWVCNSHNVSERVRTFYNRPSTVVYPPIADSVFQFFAQAQEIVKQQGKTHFLCFGALVPYKRIDLAVKCFNANGLPLEVYGSGSEMESLKALAKPNVHIRGQLPNEEFLQVIARSRALIFPGEEDFGMIPLEVMALGVPVIAYKKGGALETVVEADDTAQSTGLFFAEQEEAALQEAIRSFCQKESAYQPAFIHAHASKFSESRFLHEMQALISA